VVGGFAADYVSRDDRYDLVNCDTPEKKSIIRVLLPHPDLRSEAEELK
jgi:hypothetical protein